MRGVWKWIIWVAAFAVLTVLSILWKGLVWLIWLACLIVGICMVVNRTDEQKIRAIPDALAGELDDARVIRMGKIINGIRYIPLEREDLWDCLYRADALVANAGGVSGEVKAAFHSAVVFKGKQPEQNVE